MNLTMRIFRHRRRTAEERRELRQLEALRAIAMVEFAKGVIVLLLAFGVLSLVRHGNLWDFVESILDFLHVDLDGRFAQRFLDLADRLSDTRLWVLATYAGSYCALRFVEAYGLWKARVWAEWVALVSGAIYLPFEIYELFRRITIIRVSVLIVNLGIVLYMLYLRTLARSDQPHGIIRE
jgi:uncharacterized membrane protein (DUF2068 family)